MQSKIGRERRESEVNTDTGMLLRLSAVNRRLILGLGFENRSCSVTARTAGPPSK